jgi:hypothetical protein
LTPEYECSEPMSCHEARLFFRLVSYGYSRGSIPIVANTYKARGCQWLHFPPGRVFGWRS